MRVVDRLKLLRSPECWTPSVTLNISVHLCLLVPWSVLHPVVVVVHVGLVVGLHCVVLVVDRTL